MNDVDLDDATPITVSVDGQSLTLRADNSLAGLLARLGHVPESVAVAVNGEFVPRAGRHTHVLRDGDRVACFKPIVGG